MKIPLIAAGAVLLIVAYLATATGVSGHARVKESSPAAGEVLAASPAAVSITFTNDIQRIAGSYTLSVTDETGQEFTAGPPAIPDDDRSTMSAPLQPSLPPGRYVVKYTNLSDADGDPFEGGFAFYVGVEPTEEQLAEDALLEPPEISATQTFIAENPSTSEETPTPGAGASTPTAGPTVGGADSTDDGGGGVSPTVLFVAVLIIVIATIGGAVYFTSRNKAG